MNATLTDVNDCDGFFMDSGGSTGPYGANEDFTTTICPDNSTGTHVQLVFSATYLADGDELCFYDGVDTSAPFLTCASDFNPGAAFIVQATAANPSGCLTVTFVSGNGDQDEGWSADINCIPACQLITSIVDSTDAAVEPADTGWIDICPGDRVFFWGRGEYPQDGEVYNHSDLTSDFEWDFGDGTFTVGPNVSHVYEEPGGYIVQLEITDQFGCKNTNFISQRIRVAPRPDFALGSWPAEICAGDTVNLNAIINQMDPEHTVSVLPTTEGFQTAGIRSDSLPLPDGNGSSYLTTISFSDFAPGQVLTNINDLVGIWVTMEHSWMRDLQIRLTCPNGQTAILHNHPGQTGGEVFLGVPVETDEGFPVPIPGVGYDYGWQPNPDFNYTWIEYANFFLPNTLPEGSYESFEPLTNFLGCPLNGDWTIEVTDLWSIDNGYIFSWSIEFTEDLYPMLETFTPGLTSWSWRNHPSIIVNNLDSIIGSPVNAGEVAYNFMVMDEFGCEWDTTVDIQVLPFTHPDCHSCTDNLTPVPDTTICIGESVEMNVAGSTPSNPEVTFESYDDYPIGAGNHPPGNPYYSTINVNSIIPATITDATTDIVSICLDLETDFDADIQLALRAPDNSVLLLSQNNGGSGDNYTQTCFTPSASLPINAGAPPFTGDWQPQGNWTVLNGAPVNGNWALRVSDAFGVNAMGNLNWWSITFRTSNDITYAWSPSTDLSCDDCPDPVAMPGDNTTYIVTSNDSYSCVALDTINVAVLNNFTAPQVSCQPGNPGEMIINWTDVSPGLDYEINVNGNGWSLPNNGTLSHVLSGLVNGEQVNVEVRVLVTGAACQVGIGSSSCIYQFCPLQTTVDETGVTCNGSCDGSAVLTVSNGVPPFVFDVTNTTTGTTFTQFDNNLIDICAGQYEVIITDGTNCMDTVFFNIADQPAIMVNAMEASPVSCNAGSDGCASVSATGGNGPFTYQWNDPNQSVASMICNLEAQQYQVVATDMNGCTGSAIVEITEPDPIQIDFTTTDVQCKGGSDGTATVIPSGGVMPYTYQWSGGDSINEMTNTGLSAINYSVTVMDANGCEAFGTIGIDEPVDGVEVTAMQTLVSCFGENQSEATATAIGGTGNYDYLWTPSAQNTQTATNLPPGNFTVIVSDGSGCTASADVSITQWDAIDITLIASPPSCSGSADGEMAANIVTGGTGSGYTFLWNTGSMNDFITGAQGDNTYTVTVTDDQGCTGTKSRLLDNPPAISAEIIVTDAMCQGSDDGSATIANVINNNGMVSYLWDAAAMNQTSATASGLGAGNYSVAITDTAGCTVTEIVTIEEPQAISINFETVDNDCFGYSGGSIDTDVTGGTPGYSYNWSSGANTAKITDLPAGTFYLTLTDENGCEKIDSVAIGEPEEVSTTLQVKDVSCFGMKNGAITVIPEGGTPPYLYSKDGVNFFGSSTFIALSAGPYTITVRDDRGCEYRSDAEVNEPPELSVNIIANGQDTAELMIADGEEVELDADLMNAMGAVSYLWTASWCSTLSCAGDSTDCDIDISCANPVATLDYTNDYFLTIEDENGCRAEDHIQIHVKKERRVVVPTGFTPNDDLLNDLLVVHGKSGTMVKVFQIFDRWGELLFQDVDIPINDTSRGWNGQFKSKDMPAGVYVWYVEVEYADGMTESFKGETTLIR